MGATASTALDEHFKKQKPAKRHLQYLDKILGSIHPVHMEKVMEMRNAIELTLLDNPESENKVVSYLSGVSEKLQTIGAKRDEKARGIIQSYA